MNRVNFDVLLGKTLTRIDNNNNRDDDVIKFYTSDGDTYLMYHPQDCCENVYVEDICGELDDLIGSPLLIADEATSNENPKSNSDESFAWTFYKLATNRGSVTIRWYGESNGYYSESVELYHDRRTD